MATCLLGHLATVCPLVIWWQVNSHRVGLCLGYKVTGFFVTEAKTMCFALEEGVQEDYRTNGKDE